MPLTPDTSGSGPQPVPRPEIRPLSPGSLGASQVAAGSAASPGGSPHIEKAPPQPQNKITQFEQRFAAKRHEDNWKRTPNLTGTGAIHVKSFHCKLVGESLEFLDQQINEWLDAHPQYEVKFVTSSIGEWTGKMKEPNLIVQVWV